MRTATVATGRGLRGHPRTPWARIPVPGAGERGAVGRLCAPRGGGGGPPEAAPRRAAPRDPSREGSHRRPAVPGSPRAGAPGGCRARDTGSERSGSGGSGEARLGLRLEEHLLRQEERRQHEPQVRWAHRKRRGGGEREPEPRPSDRRRRHGNRVPARADLLRRKRLRERHLQGRVRLRGRRGGLPRRVGWAPRSPVRRKDPSGAHEGAVLHRPDDERQVRHVHGACASRRIRPGKEHRPHGQPDLRGRPDLLRGGRVRGHGRFRRRLRERLELQRRGPADGPSALRGERRSGSSTWV